MKAFQLICKHSNLKMFLSTQLDFIYNLISDLGILENQGVDFLD